MTVRIIEADDRVDAVRGCVAIERGVHSSSLWSR
jgi:hypothetical protein